MGEKSITKNYAFNMMYEVFLLLTPILVTPYVARVLSSSGVGQYSFTFSIVSYFVSFANFGFVFYSQREIAKYQKEKEKQKNVFWELVLCRAIFVVISLIVYVLTIIFGGFDRKYLVLFAILSLNIISILFDITFFFKGNDQFGKIVFRNITIRMLGISATFAFVKSSADVWIYTLIQSGMLIFSALSLWPFLPKGFFSFEKRQINIKKHIIPASKLFLPALAGSLYAFLDKSILGIILKSDSANGMYEQAEKMVKMCMTVITSLSAIMITRNTDEFNIGNHEQLSKNVEFTISFCFLLGVPLAFGIAVVSSNFSPWYFGDGYDAVPTLIKIFAPIIFISGLGTVLGQSFFVAIGEDNKFIISVVVGSVINLILNIVMISLWGVYGAAIATVLAEFSQLVLLLYFAKKQIDFGKVIIKNWRRISAGIIMFALCWLIQNNLRPSIINTAFIMIAGMTIYFLVLLITKDPVLKMIRQKH